MVIAPDLSRRSPDQAATFMANALTWNFWPKMVREGKRQPAMRFTVTADGGAIAVPRPEDTPPISAYADALTVVRDCKSGRKAPSDFPTFHVFELTCQRPRASLGWLALHPVPMRPRQPLDEGVDDEGQPTTAATILGPAHHVALMRRPELVVQYREGPELSNPAVEWVGVFKATEETDKAFAEAEPPTHDDWRANLVTESWPRRYVNVALREIRDRTRSTFGAPVVTEQAPSRSSAALVADALGHFVSPLPGTGASRRHGRSTESTGARGPNPKVTVLRHWFDEDTEAALNIEFSVTAASGSAGSIVDVGATAAIGEGGSEKEPPAGAPVPTVTRVRHGHDAVEGSTIRVAAESEATVVVSIRQPEGVAASIDIRAVAEENE